MTNDSSTLDNMTGEGGDFDTTDESTVDPRLLLPNFEGEVISRGGHVRNR